MRLQPGDEVSIVAPASPLRGSDRELLEKAVSLLESWELRVRLRVVAGNRFYLAGADSARAEHLCAALADRATKAIFCMRGGYGSPRLLPYLRPDLNPDPKIFVGYSDMTVLHAAFERLYPRIYLVHGPNVATKQFLADTPAAQTTRCSLRDLLFSRERPLSEHVEFLCPGSARGPLTGGCMSMLACLLGTQYSPMTAGRILFLEDVGEAPYRIDRMLTHFRNAGMLAGVHGIVFGEMRNCIDPHNDLRDVLRDFFDGTGVPVAFGLRSGHGESNLALKLGSYAELDSCESVFRMP